MKTHKSPIMLLVATMLLVSVTFIAVPVLAAQPPFSATITITSSGGTTIVVGETTTLTAAWSTNRDVTRYEWSIDGAGQGAVAIDGASSGSSTFDFSSSTAGTFTVSFRIWHHIQSDRDASNSITIIVTNPPQVEYTYESAYAYGGDIANSFTDNGFNNWGWSNGPLTEETYEWDLYAGAGQSDLTKGTLVGTVEVVYASGSVTLQFNVNTPNILDETQIHVYAGATMFPLDHGGDPTVAPGQYTNPGGFSAPIYVIVQAEVGIPQ